VEEVLTLEELEMQSKMKRAAATKWASQLCYLLSWGRWFALCRVSSDCLSIFEQFISEVIPIHKCHKIRCQILAIDIWNLRWNGVNWIYFTLNIYKSDPTRYNIPCNSWMLHGPVTWNVGMCIQNEGGNSEF
jgi:hypothetical protein